MIVDGTIETRVPMEWHIAMGDGWEKISVVKHWSETMEKDRVRPKREHFGETNLTP